MYGSSNSLASCRMQGFQNEVCFDIVVFFESICSLVRSIIEITFTIKIYIDMEIVDIINHAFTHKQKDAT